MPARIRPCPARRTGPSAVSPCERRLDLARRQSRRSSRFVVSIAADAASAPSNVRLAAGALVRLFLAIGGDDAELAWHSALLGHARDAAGGLACDQVEVDRAAANQHSGSGQGVALAARCHAPGLENPTHTVVQPRLAIAPQRTEGVAGQALGVQSDQRRFRAGARRTAGQCAMLESLRVAEIRFAANTPGKHVRVERACGYIRSFGTA